MSNFFFAIKNSLKEREIFYIKCDCCHLNGAQIQTSVLLDADPGLGLLRPLPHPHWNCSDLFPVLMSVHLLVRCAA